MGGSEPPRYITRHRDGVHSEAFIRRLTTMGIRNRAISADPPGNERLIGPIRRDCLDHVVIFGEQHFRHLLNSSLSKDSPIPHDGQRVRRVRGAGQLPIIMPIYSRSATIHFLSSKC